MNTKAMSEIIRAGKSYSLTSEQLAQALLDDPKLIEHIDSPSEELQTIAMSVNPRVYRLINNPCINATQMAAEAKGKRVESIMAVASVSIYAVSAIMTGKITQDIFSKVSDGCDKITSSKIFNKKFGGVNKCAKVKTPKH